MKLFRILLALLITTSGAVGACAEPHHNSETDFLMKVWAEQAECAQAWGGLLDSWRSNGGGILYSMAATRRQIALDSRSAFANLVRASWSRQPIASRLLLGQGSISTDSYRAVVLSVDAQGLVPRQCEVPIWLNDWLTSQIHLNTNVSSVRRLPEMPSQLDATDNYSASRWLFYWLFVRLPADPSPVVPNNSFKPKPLRGSD